MEEKPNPIICALDTTDVSKAHGLCESLRGQVGAIKLGLEFFTANGAHGVREVEEKCRIPLFLDLKFHDIPNTVAGAIRASAGVNTFMMTIHTAGGRAMMQAAADASHDVAVRTGKTRPLIIGVTVLTSLDQDDMHMIGLNATVESQVKRLADLAQGSGLDGVVCSPFEIELLRSHCGPDFKLVVPGIRPDGAPVGDQKRVMGPREALEKGADYLVIGRPITEALDPAGACRTILGGL